MHSKKRSYRDGCSVGSINRKYKRGSDFPPRYERYQSLCKDGLRSGEIIEIHRGHSGGIGGGDGSGGGDGGFGNDSGSGGGLSEFDLD